MGLRNKFLGLMGAALVSSMALSAQAIDTPASGGAVTRVSTFEDVVAVYLAENHDCPELKDSAGNVVHANRYLLLPSQANYEQLYTHAMAAHLSGKKVSFQYTCATSGTWNKSAMIKAIRSF